ncbi:MAG: hypothetical protein Q8Q49_01710 [bacterium]|nr:hypothetical protein [bacterium]
MEERLQQLLVLLQEKIRFLDSLKNNRIASFLGLLLIVMFILLATVILIAL